MSTIIRWNLRDIVLKKVTEAKYLEYFPYGFKWNILYFTLDIMAKFKIICFRCNPNNAKFISFCWYCLIYRVWKSILFRLSITSGKEFISVQTLYWWFGLKGAKHRLLFHGFTCDWIRDLRIRFNMKVILIRLDIGIEITFQLLFWQK